MARWRTHSSTRGSGAAPGQLVQRDPGGEADLAAVAGPGEAVVLVVGSEGKGLSRLVRETCDVVASIPMAAGTESLNAGVAAGIALYELSRRRS
jgi:23S rRNA (guanosine2251-2'-O)-methyltransferase